MYYTTKRYTLHEIGLSLQGGALIFPPWEIGRGHPLDQAGQSGPVYTLCFTQKITAANLNRANVQIRAKLRPLIQHHKML